MQLPCVWNKVLDSLHSSATTLLTTFFIHVIDVAPMYLFLIQYLPKLHKVLINSCTIKALSSLRVNQRASGLPQSELRMSLEKTQVPFGRRFPLDNFFNLLKKCLLAEWSPHITSILNPVTKNMFFYITEVLSALLRVISWPMKAKPAITKSTAVNRKSVCSQGDIFGVTCSKIINSMLDVILTITLATFPVHFCPDHVTGSHRLRNKMESILICHV